MRYLRYFSIFEKCLLIVLACLAPPQILLAECSTVARLVSVEGQVEKRIQDHEEWRSARLDEAFCAGDSLRTFHGSRAAVRLTNDTLLRLDGHSALIFTDVRERGRSLLDLLRGAVHFISRTPKSMEVRTPYLNAFIEGTEFVVRIKERATDVAVLEGNVVARNGAGSVAVTAKQTAHAEADRAPVQRVMVKPRDAVTWALYYPPLPERPGMADRLARESITALVRNRPEEAEDLVKRALAADARSAAAYMAKSYLDQARFDIPAALADSRRAAELAPQNSLVQARLAEVQMMSGNLADARQSAGRAVSLDPGLSLAHTVLGFASLREVHLDAAKASFISAITLDSAAPLPRLGLGLVKIRRGELASGREEIETAALLDPGNALLRSYMGKAYYEEKRDGLAFDQFAMAKEFDPNDPTAWYYESILLQSVNRPVEALRAQQRAIELNDNRGVYRSRQLLDQDEAARSVSLGRIYNDLNFEQQARYQATSALSLDPANHSAHRLLADSYSGIANLDAARQSELLQSKLTQPLNLDPLQPQLSNANLGLLDGSGPSDLSYNEYNSLFTRNGLALQLDASLAEHGTWGDDVVVAGLFDRLAFSVGQYHKETDLVAAENGYRQNIANGFVQYQLGEESAVQLEMSRSKEVKGDVSQRLLPEFLNIDDILIDNEISTVRFGFSGSLTNTSKLLLTAARRDFDIRSTNRSDPAARVRNDADREIDLYEAQIVSRHEPYSWLVGVSRQAVALDGVFDAVCLRPPCFAPRLVVPRHADRSQTRLYGYLFYQARPSLSLTGGVTSLGENIEDGRGSDELRKIYPKVGLRFAPVVGHEILMAAFRNRASIMPISLYETLEPTHIVGFNQLYDDISYPRPSNSWNYAAAYNCTFSNKLKAGVSTMFRELKTEMSVLDTASVPPVESEQSLEYDDRHAALWANWASSSRWVLGVDYTYNRYDLAKGPLSSSSSVLATDGILKLTTHELSTSLSYFHPQGFVSELTAKYFDQEGDFVDRTGVKKHGKDGGVIADLSLGYRFSKRRGSVSAGIKNVFGNNLNYEDRASYDVYSPEYSASPSFFSGERVLYGAVSVVFR